MALDMPTFLNRHNAFPSSPGSGAYNIRQHVVHVSVLLLFRFRSASPSNPDGPQVQESDKEAFRATMPVYRQ
jgi:hypothetical protein